MQEKSNWIAVVIVLVVFEVVCMWCIDISVSAMINQGIVMNGFFGQNPMITYHLGLYGSIISFVLLSFMFIHYVLEEDKRTSSYLKKHFFLMSLILVGIGVLLVSSLLDWWL